MLTCALTGLIALVSSPVTGGGEGGGGTAAVQQQDSSSVVIGVTDFGGTLVVSVVNDAQYKEQKKEIAIDNMAMRTAYDNVKASVYNKQVAEYKEALAKLLAAKNNNQQGGNQQQQQQQMKRAIPPFPIPVPKPRELRFYGAYKSEAEAASQKKLHEDQEAARLANLQKVTDDKAKLDNMKSAFKKPVIKKKEEPPPPKELVDQLAAEYAKVKKEMSEDSIYAATGRKAPKVSATGAELIKTKEADKKLGSDTGKSLKNSKKAKGTLGG